MYDLDKELELQGVFDSIEGDIEVYISAAEYKGRRSELPFPIKGADWRRNQH